jgi:hypothetical protein
MIIVRYADDIIIGFQHESDARRFWDARRCSQKDRTAWDRITKLADDYLPKPRILHPWPNARFAVRHLRWKRSA